MSNNAGKDPRSRFYRRRSHFVIISSTINFTPPFPVQSKKRKKEHGLITTSSIDLCHLMHSSSITCGTMSSNEHLDRHLLSLLSISINQLLPFCFLKHPHGTSINWTFYLFVRVQIRIKCLVPPVADWPVQVMDGRSFLFLRQQTKSKTNIMTDRFRPDPAVAVFAGVTVRLVERGLHHLGRHKWRVQTDRSRRSGQTLGWTEIQTQHELRQT